MKFGKIISGIAALAMAAACLSGCSGKDGNSSSKTGEVEIVKGDFSKTAIDVVKDMKVGWNLGNQLDSVTSTPHDWEYGEEAWGNPHVEKELIDLIKAQGFNTVRIPVTYINHYGEAPDYTIDKEWLDRTQEIVDYVIDNDMYAIINIHHDGSNGIDAAWLKVEEEDQTEIRDQFEKMWKQIAERFKGYDQHLIFESMNEVMESGNYGAPKKEWTYPNINTLNQIFVDTVRSSGGNNGERYLIVPGYNTNISVTANGAFEEGGFIPPIDTVENKMIISVHYYDPWDYCGEGKTPQWGSSAEAGKKDSWGQEDWLDSQMDLMKTTFMDKGYGVIIGECGAVHQKDEEAEAYREYYIEYFTQAAVSRGICPIFWDNGATGNGRENFGLISRYNCTVVYQNIIDRIMKAANGGDYQVEFGS